MDEHSERPPSKDQTFPSHEDWFRRRLKSADNPEDTGWRQSRTNFHSTSKSHRPQNGANTQTAKILKKSGGKSTASNRSKPSSNPAERVTSISTFEMKLSDFPELSDFTTASSLHQDMTVDADVRRRSSPFLNKKCQTATKAKPKTAKVFTKTEGVPNADQCCESSYLTGSSAQSWAIVASQPPKVTQRSPGTHTSSQEDLSALTTEQRTDRKKRKKKKKPKVSSQKTEEFTEDRLMLQEPPKFEDQEEFPDLSLTFEPRGQSVAQKDRNLEMKDQATTSSSASITSKKTQTSQKKSKVPVQLDLGNMLAVLEQQQQSQKSKQIQRPVTLSVGGAVPVVHKEPSVQKKVWLQEKTPHNPLDSTCPLVKKGKQREVPKAKKPTPLKRIILREREERKQSRLLEERDPLGVASEESEQASSNTENAADTKPPDVEEELDQTDTRDSSGCDDEEPDSAAPASMCEQPLEISVIENETLPSCNSMSQPSLPKIHSRKFRDYCNQVLSKDVDECVSSLLKELVRFQDRLYQKDPMKARMKRRLVMGLREVLKHLKLRKVKCVIISPNCERIQSKGGLDEALHTIIDTCREQGVPFVFALSRKVLGRCVNKSVPVSLVGIFNYDGAQDHFHKMIELSAEARKSYEVMIAKLSSEEPLEPETPQELPEEPSGAEEPEYIKIWKRMLEQDYHSLLGLEDQFSTVSISSE